jgi:hypothetical protein
MTLSDPSLLSPSDSPAKSSPRRIDIVEVCIYTLAFLGTGMFLLIPLVNLLHPSPWMRSMGFLHGMGALLATVVASYAGHLAFPLLRGNAKILGQARTLLFWSSGLVALAIISGTWAYMRYRIPAGGARAWLKGNTPLVHYVLMEWHEFTVLFTLPLAVGCCWVLWHYGDAIMTRKYRTVLTLTCLGMMALMFYALGGFATGLAIAKTHAL